VNKAFTVAAIAAGLLLSGCAPSPLENYTGKAVVKDTYLGTSTKKKKRGCKVTVILPNGTEATEGLGRRTTCAGINKGDTVQFVNGDIVR
jgi:S1-C subfamily serine protease